MVREFDYPVRGPGMLWERVRELVEEGGGRVVLDARWCGSSTPTAGSGRSSRVATADGSSKPCEAVISSMPLDELVGSIDPATPVPVAEAARALRHRALVVVGLVVRGRPSSPTTGSTCTTRTCGGPGSELQELEPRHVCRRRLQQSRPGYFCDVGDATWRLSDGELVALGDLRARGARPREVRGTWSTPFVFRQRQGLPGVRRWLPGPGGNHQDLPCGDPQPPDRRPERASTATTTRNHSMVTALRAVDNLFGQQQRRLGHQHGAARTMRCRGRER